MQDQERIRQRAHEIWEGEGRPEGGHAEHWAQASREIEAQDGKASPPAPTSPDDSPTVTSPDGGTTPAQAAAAADAVGAPRKAETGSPEPRR